MRNRFPGWLKTHMVKNEMAPKDLAKRINVTVGSVYAWLKGNSDPSPNSRKKIVKVFEESIPTKILIPTPLFGMTCKKCEFTETCMERLNNDYLIMCMSLTMDDLMVGFLEDALDMVVWWEEINLEEHASLEELAHHLNRK